ncbi:gp067 [Rhodococcus phage ReqiPepy6]|uniref:Gp067 n=1 Tax=Rhodococcus phage ReqiPepy6 TaxID=691965 RepID=D4P7H8_9CAUD|nr:gp067 [Rhodococcus phage ReqiPepy6]ADD80958.1 gp067 [Rhodococcus phage ReqiPepy6]
MEDYPSNSQKPKVDKKPAAKQDGKPEQKKPEVKQITVGTVTRRKKPLGRRVMETFGGGDAQGVGSYILQDVLLPAAKDMVADAVSQGIEKMLFGESRGRRTRSSSSGYSGGNNRTPYNSSYNGGSRYAVNPGHRQEPRQMSHRGRATHNFDEIVLDSRAEATEVLDNLYSMISQYDVATVADLYNMVGVTGDFTDEKWGWVELHGAQVRHVRDGYLLELPRPEHLG